MRDPSLSYTTDPYPEQDWFHAIAWRPLWFRQAAHQFLGTNLGFSAPASIPSYFSSFGCLTHLEYTNFQFNVCTITDLLISYIYNQISTNHWILPFNWVINSSMNSPCSPLDP